MFGGGSSRTVAVAIVLGLFVVAAVSARSDATESDSGARGSLGARDGASYVFSVDATSVRLVTHTLVLSAPICTRNLCQNTYFYRE